MEPRAAFRNASAISSPTSTSSATPPSWAGATAASPPAHAPHLRPNFLKIESCPSTAASPPAIQTPMMPAVCGPLAAHVSIPPRPKPGRRPATDDPPSKRKAQNREAQRNFRQRRAEKLDTLEGQLKDEQQRTQEARRTVDERDQQLRQKDDQLKAAERTIRELELHTGQLVRALNDARRELQQRPPQSQWTHPFAPQKPVQGFEERRPRSETNRARPANIAVPTPAPTAILRPENPQTPPSDDALLTGCGGCKDTGECPCVDTFMSANAVPASQAMSRNSSMSGHKMAIDNLVSPPSEHYETDFTARHASLGPNVSADKPSEPILVQAVQKTLEGDNCNFCSEDDNCCQRQSGLLAPLTPAESFNAQPSSPAATNNGPVVRMGPPPNVIAPGSCDQCRDNADMRRTCLELAAQRSARSISRSGSASGRSSPAHKRLRLPDRSTPQPRDIEFMPCWEGVKLLTQMKRDSTASHYEEVFNQCVTVPTSRRQTAVVGQWSPATQERKYSAFEVGMARGLMDLAHQKPNSSSNGNED